MYKDAVTQNMKQMAVVNDRVERKLTCNKEEKDWKYEKTKVVYEVGNQNLIEELGKSAVGETMYPIDVGMVEELIKGVIPSIQKPR